MPNVATKDSVALIPSSYVSYVENKGEHCESIVRRIGGCQKVLNYTTIFMLGWAVLLPTQ